MASPDLLIAAMRLLAAGAWSEAEGAARAAVQADSNDPNALLVLGLAIAATGDDARAAPLLVHVAAFQPDNDHPCVDLIRMKPPLPRPLVAKQFRACLRLVPHDDRLRLAFAAFLLDIGQPAEAETCLSDASESAASHHLMGLTKAELNRFSSAAVSFRNAVEMNPDAAASWSNLGVMLKIEGRFDDAIAAHHEAVALDPANPRFRINRAIALLKAGHWQQAWEDYEARFEETDLPGFDPTKLLPSLDPTDGLAGMTVLALHEGGFGDTLQFIRYLPALAERGARVIVGAPGKLGRLLRMVPGVAEVVTEGRAMPAYNFVCPMFSLPRVFGTTIESIPPAPAIFMDAALAKRWAGHLPTGGLRAGLVWAGQARPALPGFDTLDSRRSMTLDTLAPLFDVPGVAFVSLQHGPAARAPRPAGLRLTDPMPDVADFADTAAIIAGLDVVITVDTSVAHLAAHMRKPVFLLDRYDGCWRWLAGRTDSPWYPNLTIFRQDQPGDWSAPVARVAASLQAMALYRGFSPRCPGVRERAFVA